MRTEREDQLEAALQACVDAALDYSHYAPSQENYNTLRRKVLQAAATVGMASGEVVSYPAVPTDPANLD